MRIYDEAVSDASRASGFRTQGSSLRVGKQFRVWLVGSGFRGKCCSRCAWLLLSLLFLLLSLAVMVVGVGASASATGGVGFGVGAYGGFGAAAAVVLCCCAAGGDYNAHAA